MTKQTQIDALLMQIQTGKIETDKAKILNYIKNNPSSSRIDITAGLNMHEYTVGARISDLEDMGLIVCLAKNTKEQRGSKQSTYIFVHDEVDRIVLAEARHRAKYIKWVNKGMNEFCKYMPNDLIEELQSELEDEKVYF